MTNQPQPAKRLWLVMKLNHWGSITLPTMGGISLSAGKGEAIGFLPVFDNYRLAVKNAGGRKHVKEITA